ncbi:MAG TPA: error-prone DNA polymerase [Polyangiaceae bacterium]|nr:error-prone DNA polymerase [Polyangiaceae bacterium]
MAFVELAARSTFSFLRGASHPEEVIDRAQALGVAGVALCDRDGLYGAARAHARAREIGQKLHFGAELPLAFSEQELESGSHEPILGSLSERQRRQLLRGAKPNALRKRLLLEDGYPPLILLVKDHQGYQNLCWLLTRAHANLPKGECLLELDELEGHTDGLIALVPTVLNPILLNPARLHPIAHSAIHSANAAARVRQPSGVDAFSKRMLGRLCDEFSSPSAIFSLTYRRLNRHDAMRTALALERERRHGLPILASAWPTYHCRSRKRLADVVQCIRLGMTLSEAKTKIASNGQAYLRSPSQMFRLFPEHAAWIERTAEVAAELRFSLEELQYHFPCKTDPGETADSQLSKLSWAGAQRRYPNGIPAQVARQIESELQLIARMEVAAYFLSTWEVVEIARERGILCQGRGSAANSAVCYVLGITAVNPECSNLLFERFMSVERKEPPDIDVDFEHERREEVIQELYRRYGRDQAAMVSEVICYRSKSALREVSKVFSLSSDQSDRLANAFSHWDAFSHEDQQPATEQRLREAGLSADAREVRGVLEMTAQLVGFPRHLSIHVGGFVLSSRPLHEVSPVEPARMENRSVVPWDKDDLDILGFFKIDVLALGMLTAVRKALHSVWLDGGLQGSSHSRLGSRTHDCHGSPPQFDSLEVITRIPDEDPAVYALTSQADTVGVFQIESRAQMAMLPRLRPRCFYDLVIEVAIVRPGPIQGGMVHPYLRRRNHEEAASCHPLLSKILERTLGVPLFQEQVMQIAITGAGYSGGEADQLRRDMAAWKRTGRLLRHKQRLLAGFAKHGIERSFGEALFEQIKGFGEYGFPESHAASFASLVYKSAWLKAHYPAHFVCALLNSQPMGFYSAASLVKDAQKHGVDVRPVSVLESDWDCTLEWRSLPGDVSRSDASEPKERSLRLGLRMIKGLRRESAERLLERRRELLGSGRAFASFPDFVRQLPLPKRDIEALAEAGAFEPLLEERRQVLWAARAPRQLGLFRDIETQEPAVHLPKLQAVEVLALDYERVRLSIADHPLRHLRSQLDRASVITTERLTRCAAGEHVAVAGLVLARQRPGTASGVVFVTLEDETGIANLIFYSRVFDAYRHAAQHSSLLLVRGKVERQDPKPGSIDLSDPRQKSGVASIVHLIVESAARLNLPGPELNHTSRDFR